jgi:transcriptional regulator with XRE-family HTH domain
VAKQLRTARHRALIAELVAAREAVGLSQRDFAKKLKESNNFVWRIEAGERRVDVLEFVHICETAGVDPFEVLKRVLR